MPRINTTVGEHFTGLGDMVLLAWVAEGTRDAVDPISFFATRGNLKILRLLGQDVSESASGAEVVVSSAYRKELDDGGAKLRLDYVREVLGIDTPFKRPMVQLSADALAWAEATRGQLAGELVLLFPQTLWEGRAWPPVYWVELAWMLKRRNVAAVVMLRNEDKRFTNTPHFLWGYDLEKVAALMSVSKLVVSNDSGPAHLSGTIGVPTMVTCGPTRSTCVYGHIPDVIALSNDEPPLCTGCHFQPPYRAACDLACQALYALKPHVVLGRAISKIAQINTARPVPPAGLAK
jgi:hypothetical protein